MDLFKIFRNQTKIQQNTTTKKSFVSNISSGGLFDLFSRDQYNPSVLTFINYYRNVMPLSNAIDMIAESYASIPLKVWDTNAKQFIDHEVLDLLRLPNADVTQKEFLRSYAKFFMITGNSFQIATGDLNRPPLELMVVPPQSLSVFEAKDGFAERYFYTQNRQGGMTFTRKEIDGRFRFFNSNDKELYHSKDFNPDVTNNRLWGLSKLQSIRLELDQYFHASVHNDSLLLNQARPSGALVAPAEVSQDDIAFLREEIDKMYSGPINTGRPMFLGNGVDWKAFSQNMKDMDFIQMKKTVTEAIYNRLRIPLAMVESTGLSLANMEHSPLTFYDNAVLPLADFINTELTDFLMRRYPNSEELVITFDPVDVTALESRRIDSAKNLSTLNVLSDNEMRTIIGRDPIEGGDVVFKPSNSVPAEDLVVESDDGSAPADKPKFIELMKSQIYGDGTRVFSDQHIDKLVKDNGFR